MTLCMGLCLYWQTKWTHWAFTWCSLKELEVKRTVTLSFDLSHCIVPSEHLACGSLPCICTCWKLFKVVFVNICHSGRVQNNTVQGNRERVTGLYKEVLGGWVGGGREPEATSGFFHTVLEARQWIPSGVSSWRAHENHLGVLVKIQILILQVLGWRGWNSALLTNF